MAKTTCPVSRTEFRNSAKPTLLKLGSKDLVAKVMEFSTGSLGWNVNDKVEVEIGGKRVMCQLGLNLTIIGSKEAAA